MCARCMNVYVCLYVYVYVGGAGRIKGDRGDDNAFEIA